MSLAVFQELQTSIRQSVRTLRSTQPQEKYNEKRNNMMTALERAVVLLLVSVPSLVGMAQTQVQPQTETPLAQAFADLRSGDQSRIDKWSNGDHLVLLLDKEMPTIEKDTATICGALADPNPVLRLRASAILTTIVIAAHQHNSVVQACFPNLIKAASDPVDQTIAQSLKPFPPEQTRNNLLFVLAMNPSGPPPAAHGVFVASLQSSNYRTQECGAAGLLKEGTNQEANQNLVLQALYNAPDKKGRLNILYAISGARVRSDTLFEGVQKYLLDPDDDVQTEAINAVAATGKDHDTVASVIQGVVDSPTATKEQKLRARMALGTTPQ
jgi:hypothetical protein